MAPTPAQARRGLQRATIEALLRSNPVRRSAHFLAHHLPTRPETAATLALVGRAAPVNTPSTELSTGDGRPKAEPVDRLALGDALSGPQPAIAAPARHVAEPVAPLAPQRASGRPPKPLSGTHQVALVVPKRHAKRSVTRSLLRRQMLAAFEDALKDLPPGCWLLRLRAPFDRAAFPSASSTALRRAARSELLQFFAGTAPTQPRTAAQRAGRKPGKGRVAQGTAAAAPQPSARTG